MNMELEIKKIIEESSSDIATMVKENLKKDLVNSLTWSVKEQTSKIVQEFFNEELKGEVKKALEDAKPQLKQELEKAVVCIAAEAGKKMIEVAAQNLTNSYKVRELTEKLFR